MKSGINVGRNIGCKKLTVSKEFDNNEHTDFKWVTSNPLLKNTYCRIDAVKLTKDL